MAQGYASKTTNLLPMAQWQASFNQENRVYITWLSKWFFHSIYAFRKLGPKKQIGMAGVTSTGYGITDILNKWIIKGVCQYIFSQPCIYHFPYSPFLLIYINLRYLVIEILISENGSGWELFSTCKRNWMGLTECEI